MPVAFCQSLLTKNRTLGPPPPCFFSMVSTVYCAITALDGYPSHSDNIHYIRSATLMYALPPSTDHDHHFHLQHSSHPPFASGRHLLIPEPSHPSHVIGSFVTGTTITSARQEDRPCGSITSETSRGMWWKPRQWRF